MGIATLIEHVEQRARREFGVSRHDAPPPPLYAYQLSNELFNALRDDLRHDLRTTETIDTFVAAAFCLYGAEQFCREHQRGPWKWSTVLQPLAFRPTPAQLYLVVRRGMTYWRRPIHDGSSGTEYLFTLGCEGGLPLRVLQNEGASLRRFVQRVLLDREAYRFTTTRELIVEHQECLPPLLRNESVFEICARLIDAVIPLRRRCRAAKDPIAHLDGSQPGWRNHIPLRLDIDVASKLLSGLLTEAGAVESTSRLPFRLELGLQNNPSMLIRRVRIAPEIPSDDFARTLGVDATRLPSQVHLYVQDTAGARLPFAVASAYGDVFRLHALDDTPSIDPYCDVEVVAAIRAKVLAQTRVPGSEGTPSDMPLFFADNDDPLRQFLSAGCLRTRRDHAICLVPEDAEILDTGKSDWKLLDPVSGYRGRAYRIGGTVELRCGDQKFRASTRADAEGTGQYRLVGKRQRLGLGGSEVFIGQPTVREVSNDLFSTPVRDSSVEWRFWNGAGREWRHGLPNQPGDVEVRVTNDSSTLYRVRGTVFPTAFRHEIQPDRNGPSGVIWFEGVQGAQIGVASDALAEWKLVARGSRQGVWMRSQTTDPPAVSVRFRFATGGEATVRVPFPATVRHFVDRSGQPIANGAFLPLHRVPGVRAIARTADTGRKFQLIARLFHGHMPARYRDIPLDFLERTDDTTFELPLDLVIDLVQHILSNTDVLDAKVRIHLNELGGPGRDPFFIEAGRYDSWLDKVDLADGSGYKLGLADGGPTLEPAATARLELRAARLADPTQVVRTLPRTADGTWLFSFEDVDAGAWLVTGWVGERSLLRPLLVTVHGDRNRDTSPLRAAVELPTADRRTEIGRVLAECAQDITSPHWTDVLPYLETVQTLPASTFDVVRELIRQPGAVVRALLRRPALAPTLLRRLEHLPFLFKLVPIEEWISGARDSVRLHEHRHQILGQVGDDLAASYHPAKEAGTAIRSVLLAAAAASPSGVKLHHLLRYALRSAPDLVDALGEPERRLDADREARNDRERTNPLHLQLVSAKESVLRNNADRQWLSWAWDEAARALGILSLADLEAPQHTRGVLYAPLVAAGVAVCARPADPQLIFDLKRMMAFDEAWFESAYAVWLDRLVQMRILSDGEFLK
jgi:hypothetical protein